MKTFFAVSTCLFLVSCSGFQSADPLHLEGQLTGKWKAKAFAGELREEWRWVNGGMQQRGYYIENNDTTYSARTRIEAVGDDLILFSVIRNSTPKIFQATHRSDSTIIFENKDYRNPYEVTYEFFSPTRYRRTITGIEADTLVSYVFNFEKLE